MKPFVSGMAEMESAPIDAEDEASMASCAMQPAELGALAATRAVEHRPADMKSSDL